MTVSARESANVSTSRLFAFKRVRGGSEERIFPGAGTRLHFGNRDTDTLEMPGMPSGLLAAGDVVTAHYRGACVFRGEVAKVVKRDGRGTDQTETVTCVGPWSKMERLVYRQQWFMAGGSKYSSRLCLNQTAQGEPQTLHSELLEIAGHGATPCGYSVSSSDVFASSLCLPFDECRDITVAEAIRRELRFFPCAVTRFDYSGSTPALKIERPGGSAAAYVAAVPKTLRERVYSAHPITGVCLEIETVGTVNGVTYRDISNQTAGDTAPGNPDCLYATLQIRGASSGATRGSFTSVTEDIPQNLADAAWWKARHPRLANVALNAIAISGASRSPSNYPRISAATAGEIEAAGLHCEVSTFTCSAKITTTDDVEEDLRLTMQYLTTNATGTAESPKTYTWVTDSWSDSGETVPSGLAAAILADRSGALESLRMTVRLADAFPKIGDLATEDGETLRLQAFDVDCTRLLAELHFGVPDHLTPEDMASLLSGFRNKCSSSLASVRTSGARPAKGEVELGALQPLSSTEFAPGRKTKTTIKGAGSSGSIELDSSAVPSGKKIATRTLTVKGKNYKVLADADMEIEGGEAGVERLNGAGGIVSVIGGVGVSVSTSGQTIMISANADKTTEDSDPNARKDPCEPHPGGGDGGGTWDDADETNADEQGSGGFAGGGVAGSGGEGTGGGCDDCGGSSSTGSSGSSGIQPGASGSSGSAPSVPNGKSAASAPSTGGGAAAQTGKQASSGLFNGSTISKTTMGSRSTSQIYGGTHSSLTSSKTMNQSPLASTARTLGTGATTAIYGGSHSSLTSSRTMNQSPFKTAQSQ